MFPYTLKIIDWYVFSKRGSLTKGSSYSGVFGIIKFENPWCRLVWPTLVVVVFICTCLGMIEDRAAEIMKEWRAPGVPSGSVRVCHHENGLSSKLTARPAEVALHGPGQKPADCLEYRGSTLVLKHSLTSMRTHTRIRSHKERLWRESSAEREEKTKVKVDRTVQSIAKKRADPAGAREGLASAVFLFFKELARDFAVQVSVLYVWKSKGSGSWSLLLLILASPNAASDDRSALQKNSVFLKNISTSVEFKM